MFNKPYSFQKLGEKQTLLPEPVKKAYYRFKASKRTYFVILETFSYGIVAIKYCDVKDKNSRNAYKKIFNDGDAFRVITTCLFIMLSYWKEHPAVTFAFYAVPRENLNCESSKRRDSTLFRNTRFRIYQYAMLNLFPPTKFIQLRDSTNCLYILLNKKQKKPKTTLKKMGSYLLANYEMIFSPDTI